MTSNRGGVMSQKYPVIALVALLVCAPLLLLSRAQAAVPKTFSLDCEDGTLIRVTELSVQSTYRNPLGDRIEVRLMNPQTGTSQYRLSAAFPGDFGGRWVYRSSAGPNFSLLLSGQSLIWYLEFDGQPSIRCARDASGL